MPTNGEIAAFWLQYEYVRLDTIGTVPALQAFLDSARDEGLQMPVEYQLDIADLESRTLHLTPESQHLWSELMEASLDEVLQPADNPLESSWYSVDNFELLVNEWQSRAEIGGFVLFSAVSIAPVSYSARTELLAVPQLGAPTPHVYHDRNVKQLHIDCSVVRNGQGLAADDLIRVDVSPSPGGNAPIVPPTPTVCNGFPCFTYRNTAEQPCLWTTRVSPVRQGNVIGYQLRGSRDPKSINIHTFMR